MWILLLLLAGCSTNSESVSTVYGRYAGKGSGSVNGTRVLAGMFKAAGHQVVRRGGAAANVDGCQVIVWAPDNFQPPTLEERRHIESWLGAGAGRTFVYIGRDYDAAVHYWQHAASGAADAQAEEFQRRLAVARSEHDSRRAEIPAEENADWFVVRRDHSRLHADALAGPWSDGIDSSRTAITLQAHYDVPNDDEKKAFAKTGRIGDEEFFPWGSWDPPEFSHEVLLWVPESQQDDDPFDQAGGFRPADGIPLVTRVTHPYWSDSAVVVVTNGSFLLNFPLVNHEHRKLAGRLIEECGSGRLRVAFWEGAAFRPWEGDAEEDQWAVLTTWPLSFVLLHLAMLGIVYVLWKFPIFGPARRLPETAPSDFGKHISALGELMAATGEAAYAHQRLEAYAEKVRGEMRGKRDAGRDSDRAPEEAHAAKVLEPPSEPGAKETADPPQ